MTAHGVDRNQAASGSGSAPADFILAFLAAATEAEARDAINVDPEGDSIAMAIALG